MFHVLGCISEQHDLRLVLLAGLLCLLSAITAISMIRRAQVSTGVMHVVWLVTAGLIAGAGIWATHFVAMLGYEAGVPVTFEWSRTVLSALIAVVLCTAGFASAFGRTGPVLGGLIIGIAIAAMHYTGMTALRLPATVSWDVDYIAASALMGMAFNAFGLWIVITHRKAWADVAGALCFILAVGGTHFTGMAAVTLHLDPGISVTHHRMDSTGLALIIAVIAILMVGIGLIGTFLDGHLAGRAAAEQARLRQHIAELEAAKAQLEHLSHDLTIAVEAAAAASESKSRFLAAMSHELRTPLNAIIGFADMMVSEMFGPLGSPRYLSYVDDIHTSGRHLLSLINDILDLSKLDARQVELREEDVNLRRLSDAALQMIARQAQINGVSLIDEVPPDLPLVRCDPRRLKQVMLNLLSNAVKFTPGGGEVRITAGLVFDAMVIQVVDSGIGIDKKDMARAMERFGQVDSRLARKFEGTGLGLPLVRELVALHGGSLELESTVGVGTTARITLPASRILKSPQTQAA
jgi:signal transduction histidine kinase